MSSSTKASDSLSQTVEEIRTFAKEEGFVVFYGLTPEDETHTVYWIKEQGDWKAFLEGAKTLGVKLLYLNWAPFEGFQIEEALEGVGVQDSKVEKAESEECKRDVEEYRNKVGLISLIDLAFLWDGVFHVCRLTAEWFEAFEELVEEGKERAEEENERKPDKALVGKWAAELANHPKFGSCKTYAQREYLLEGLSKGDYRTLPVSDILNRAETVYLFEVRPKEEERLRDEARRLRNEGLNMNAIALRLGISRDRVSGLLANSGND